MQSPAAEPIIMGMPDLLEPAYWTAEMVRALPDDGRRYEVVYGELLVTPAPRLWHQELVGRLFVRLSRYLEAHPVGHLLVSPADISWDEGTLVQPDLFVADHREVRTLDWSAVRTLKFVAEVLSPSTSRHDRFTKRRRYQEAGVGIYWVLDPDRQLVEVWTPDDLLPLIEHVRATWHPDGAEAPFVLELAEYFKPLEG